MLHGDLSYRFYAERVLEIRREVERNRQGARLAKAQASSGNAGIEKPSLRRSTADRIAAVLTGLFKPNTGAES